ncbi:MAG: C25 family cysteine peptidase [Bdellovibrionota bacterium]|nr:C25 family cysteine peptidase [Bdellovibrionota bacterium]
MKKLKAQSRPFLLLVILLFSELAQSEVVHFFDQEGRPNRMTMSSIKNRGFKGKRINFFLRSMEVNDVLANDYFVADKFQDVSFYKLSSTDEVDKPKLPYMAIFLKGKPTDFKINISRGEVSVVKDLLPKPNLELPCRCLKTGDYVKPLDWDIYKNSRKKLYEVEYLGDFKGLPISRLKLYPTLYEADRKVLKVFPNIKFNIFHRSQDLEASHKIDDLLDLARLNKKFVVVGPERFFEALVPWRDWKEKQGFEIDFFAIEEIGTRAKDVKKFLHRLYKKEKFTWSLLIGHEEIMPTEYVKTNSHDKTPSDLNYFTMGGKSDSIPDVYYGRFVVDSVQDLESQIKKIIKFESKSFEDLSGLRRQIGIASDEGYDPTDVEYLEQMQSPLKNSFNLNIYKFLQENGNSTPENINKVLTKGAVWLNYIGHGEGSTWPSLNLRSYHSNDIKNIDSEGRVKPVIIDVACQNGRFSYENRLGERFLNEFKGENALIGAVAYYGGTVDISWHPPAKMAVEINKILAKGKVNQLGKLLFEGQMELFKKHSNKSEVIDNLKWYHLLGDPSLLINLN